MESVRHHRSFKGRKIRRHRSSMKPRVIHTSVRPSQSLSSFNVKQLDESNHGICSSSAFDSFSQRRDPAKKQMDTARSSRDLPEIVVNDMNDRDQRSAMISYREKRDTPRKKGRRRRCPWTYLFGTSCCIGLLAMAIAAALILGLMRSPITRTTATTTTTTSATTTTTTTSVTTTTMTSTSTSTSTSTTSTTSTTTTTSRLCGPTCVNESLSTASLLASYSFDNALTDSVGTYHLTSSITRTYVPGWIGSAVSFNAAQARGLNTSNLPISGRSFSIDFWFYALNVSSGWDIPFVGQFGSFSASEVLFCTIFAQRLYFGLYADDSIGTTVLNSDTWYHAAFAHDNSSMTRSIYLNGLLENQHVGLGPLRATTGPFTVGWARIGGRIPTIDSYYTGYLDQLTVSRRVKSPCEIYLTANLACYLKFDAPSLTLDSGPNRVSVSNAGALSLSNGRVNQAIVFSTPDSFITIADVAALRSPAVAFTISMWINPSNVTIGTLIHASTQSNGQGRCVLMWGLTTSGFLTMNVIDPMNNTIAVTSTSPVLINRWTHVVQSWSVTNGHRLYIDGWLVSSVNAATGQPVGPFVMVGGSPIGTSGCPGGTINRGQYLGSVDEFRVFRTELTDDDICCLANP